MRKFELGDKAIVRPAGALVAIAYYHPKDEDEKKGRIVWLVAGLSESAQLNPEPWVPVATGTQVTICSLQRAWVLTEYGWMHTTTLVEDNAINRLRAKC